MEIRRIIELLRHGTPGESIKVQGWVRTKRELKEFAFLDVNDGSSLQGLQVVVNQNLPEYEQTLKLLNTGSKLIP